MRACVRACVCARVLGCVCACMHYPVVYQLEAAWCECNCDVLTGWLLSFLLSLCRMCACVLHACGIAMLLFQQIMIVSVHGAVCACLS